MAKLNVKTTSENGKVKSCSGNEYIETDIYFGNKKLGTIVLRVMEDTNGDPNMYLLQWQDVLWQDDWQILREGDKNDVVQLAECPPSKH